MAIKDFYQSIRPTLDLNFAGTSTVDPRITFSRASTATYFDEFGVMRTAHANAPRIDFDPVTGECKGLLIEEQRTNLLKYSEQFDNVVWDKNSVSVVANAITAPDGSQTADKVIENTSNSEHFVRSPPISCPAGTYISSVYWHESSERSLYLRTAHVGETYSTSQVVFNKSTLTLGSVSGNGVSASAQRVGNGWWRICLVFYITGTRNVQHGCQLWATTSYYSGDDTSGIYVWGAQLEAGSFTTSYIPTTTAQVTRAADVAIMTGVNFSSWYEQDEGAFISVFDSAGYDSLIVYSVSDGTSNESMYLTPLSSSNGNKTAFTGIVGGIAQAGLVSSTPYAANSKTTYALAYKADDFAGSINGEHVASDVTATLPIVGRLSIGSNWSASSNFINGHIHRLAYYPKRLSNYNLQALSA